MSATAISERALPRERVATEGRARRLFEPRTGSLSLEDLIVGTWDELTALRLRGLPGLPAAAWSARQDARAADLRSRRPPAFKIRSAG